MGLTVWPVLVGRAEVAKVSADGQRLAVSF